ncbi:hypothetical protein QJS04_geneDACA013607 [Acorus gramineus]|uniref:Uncharacterized protein n=1 Tax=Acorus gramineus TaxID=55184 RepID=A0AAV9AH48_ACOGR|nr:hypothetical protein QJS04_geneDACA013607 [Acorus gramineus]
MCFNGVVDLVREYFAWLLKTCLDFMGSIVLMLFRSLGLFIPGFVSHNLKEYYVDIGGRLSKLIPSHRSLRLFIPRFASHDLRDHVNIIGERLTKLIPSSVSVGPSIPGFGTHSLKDHVNNIAGRLAKLIPATSRVDPMGLVSSIAGRSFHKRH